MVPRLGGISLFFEKEISFKSKTGQSDKGAKKKRRENKRQREREKPRPEKRERAMEGPHICSPKRKRRNKREKNGAPQKGIRRKKYGRGEEFLNLFAFTGEDEGRGKV